MSDVHEPCTHPWSALSKLQYPDAGYLNVETGWRIACTLCGTSWEWDDSPLEPEEQ